MRSPVFTITLLFLLGAFVQPSVASSPLVIDINNGIDAIPHETGDVDKTITSSFIQTVEAENIRDSHLGLAQVIENYSGIKIRQFGGLGSQSLVSIRGKSADQVMIYLDGMLLNNASGGSVDLSQIPIDQIVRIEVYKDIIPIEFSEASNGGVINIITRRTKKTNTTRISVGAGMFKTHKLTFAATQSMKKWQYVASGTYLKSNNNYKFTFENGTPESPDDHEVQNRQNNQLSQYNLIAKAKHSITEQRTLQFAAEFFNKNKHIPSLRNRTDTHTYVENNDKHFYANYIDRQLGSKNLELNLNAKASLKSQRYDDSERQIGLVKMLIDQNIKTFSGKGYVKYRGNTFDLVSNNTLRYETLNLDDFYNSKNSKDNKRMTFSSGLQAYFYLNNKKLIVSPAVRYFISQDNYSGYSLFEDDTKIDLSQRYSTLAPQFGLRYQLTTEATLKFNAGQYYRLPNYIELFGISGYLGSNESLLPEKGINMDAGFEYLNYLKGNRFTQLNWDFSVFHSWIENEINYSFNSQGIGKPSNNYESTISGIENNITLEMFYDIDVVSQTTLLLPLNKSDPGNTKILGGRSIWSQTTRLVLNHNQWQLFFEHVWESPYYYDNEERLPGKEKSVFNSGFNANTKKLAFSLSLNNIFSHQNKDYFTQPSPELSIFFTASLKLS